MKIETGDILVVLEGQHKLADIIMKVTRSRAHHVGVFRDPDTVSEMERPGHVLTPWSDPKYDSGKAKDRTLVLMKPREPFTYEQKEEIKRMIDTNDTRYDFAALVKHLIYKRWGWWLGRRTARAAKRMTCSEWVAFLYYNFKGKWRIWYKASPHDIFTDHQDHFDYYCMIDGDIFSVM